MKTPREYRQMEFRPLLVELVKLFKPRCYVELGVKDGWTFNEIAPMVPRAVAVDIGNMMGIHRWPQVQVFQMTSEMFASEWKNRGADPIDLLFVDADHERDAVLQDVFLVGDFVPLTGLILLHDTHPVNQGLLADGYCANAWEAAREIHHHWPDYEIVTLPGPWAGLSIIRRLGDHHLAWLNDQKENPAEAGLDEG